MKDVLRLAVAGFGCSGALARAVAEGATVPGLLRKWGIGALAAAARFAAGVVPGNVAHGAMCASAWSCE